MNNWSLAIVFVVDAIIMCFIIVAIVRRVWAPLAEQFPESPISPEAFRKNFQTVAIGSVNLGFSVHLAADDDYLHWIPIQYLRVFGCKTLSIPWKSMHATPKQPILQKSVAKVSLDGQSKPILTVPRWCLDIKNTVAPDSVPKTKSTD